MREKLGKPEKPKPIMSEKPGKLKEHTGKLKEQPGKLKPSVRKKPGKPREQPNMHESVKYMTYKRDWIVFEENRN